MIKCITLDDEPLALQQLATYIDKVPFLELAGEFTLPDAAKQFIENNDVDAMFVDINMPDTNGLDFVRSLSRQPVTVFTTAYDNYAIDAYKVNAIDYLLKPFGQQEFNAVADKIKGILDQRAHVTELSDIDENDAVYVKTDYKIMRIDVSDISYVEALSEYLRIHTISDTKSPVVLLSMRRIEERLPATMFKRIHRSYIINVRQLSEISRHNVVLRDGTSLPVGDTYKDAFFEYINSKFLSK